MTKNLYEFKLLLKNKTIKITRLLRVIQTVVFPLFIPILKTPNLTDISPAIGLFFLVLQQLKNPIQNTN
jgi:hypothetical protein